MNRAVIIIFLLFFFVPPEGHASVSVELTLDKSFALITDTVVLKVKVNGKRKSSPPEIEGLALFGTTKGGTSSRFEMSNGEMNSSVEYTFYLNPSKKGSFVIGPATVKAGTKIFKSNKVFLEISAKQEKMAGKNRGTIFVESYISKNKLYVNEQSLYTIKFFRTEQVSNLSLTMPEVDGLVFESLTEPKKYNSIVDSKRYDVIEIKYLLIPQKAGEYTIPPAKMSMTVYQRSRRDSLFNDPFFGLSTGKPGYLSSNEIRLTVKKLPDLNKPMDFSGLVGEFNIKNDLEPEKIKAKDSTTLTVHVRGRGNIRQIPDLKIGEIEGLKIYQDKPVLNIEKGDSYIAGEKTMKWAIVPEKGGEYKIPVLALTYFDPVKEKYKKLETEPFVIKALEIPQEDINISGSLQAINGHEQKPDDLPNNKKKIKTIGKDIFPVHTTGYPSQGHFMHNGTKRLIITGIICPPLVFFGLLLGKSFGRKKMKNSLFNKSRSAKNNFIKKIRDKGVTPEVLYNAVLEYLNARFLLKGGVVTPAEAAGILEKKGVPVSTCERLKQSLDRLESIIFARAGQSDFSDIKNELLEIIKYI